jgi:SWI/SNF-related matrix-associated actin-dependent regulator 1 of chromatin subfamily A
LKQISTLNFKNAHKLIQNFTQARVTLLSGTPIANRVDDMYAYFKLIGHVLGASFKSFTDSYGIMYNSKAGAKVKKAKNTEDLSVKLSNFMIRRTQKEVFDLPQKQQIKYKIDKEDFQAEYDELISQLSLQKNHAAVSGHIMAINRLTSNIKVPEAIKISQEILDYGKKVVIFCSFTEPLTLLREGFSKLGHKSVTIDGSVEMAVRKDLVNEFWNDEETNVFLLNMKAGGEGINLSCAADIIFMNYGFTPKDMEQPMERCTNPSDPKIITIHYLMCEESIDEVLHDIIVDKKQDIDAIVDKGQGSVSIDSITSEVFRRLTGADLNVKEVEEIGG